MGLEISRSSLNREGHVAAVLIAFDRGVKTLEFQVSDEPLNDRMFSYIAHHLNHIEPANGYLSRPSFRMLFHSSYCCCSVN
jgi:hypothetical protein